jgi:hypothetical protein
MDDGSIHHSPQDKDRLLNTSNARQIIEASRGDELGAMLIEAGVEFDEGT